MDYPAVTANCNCIHLCQQKEATASTFKKKVNFYFLMAKVAISPAQPFSLSARYVYSIVGVEYTLRVRLIPEVEKVNKG